MRDVNLAILIANCNLYPINLCYCDLLGIDVAHKDCRKQARAILMIALAVSDGPASELRARRKMRPSWGGMVDERR
jgi:hypothetical protein